MYPALPAVNHESREWNRNARDARQKLDAAGKELAAARTEINTLKAALAATQTRLDKLEKAAVNQAKPK